MIELFDASKTYQQRRRTVNAVRGVSLTVRRGEVAAVIGPSGGGKSTLLRCINGLETFAEGEVQVDEIRLQAGSGHARVVGTLRQLRRLPATAAGLKALLLRYFAAPGATGGDLPASSTAWLWQAGTGMITDMPLSPAQRAAAYRMLAGLPGVRSLGRVTDPAGRHGTAVELTSRTDAAGTEASILIVDPRTGIGLTESYLVTIIAPDGLSSDPLSKVASVLGPESVGKITRAYPTTKVRFAYGSAD